MGIWNRREQAESTARLEALDRFQAIVEFAMDGTVITANQNFLYATGYQLDEIRGKPHSMFVDPEYAASNAYKEFWDRLRQGGHRTGRFKQIGKNGREMWVQASCNPIMDNHNKLLKIVTYAIDITELVSSRMEIAGLIKESSENIKNVSSAAEGMSASINEINRNMNLSKTAVGDIVSKINFAEEASKQLLKTSKSMAGIVEFIRGIAEQVNLLALNATIEAARAGEAGKGFAVVASEVKNLANQTGAATDNISKEIAEMQDISTKVASSVAEAVKTADLVSEYVSSVAVALEEQSIVTRDISGNTHKSLDLIGNIRNCLLKG